MRTIGDAGLGYRCIQKEEEWKKDEKCNNYGGLCQ